jgi:cystathionine beta-lyase family protein involved in aluminum resistance
MSIRHEYNLEKLAGEVEEEVQYIYRAIEKRALINHAKVLKAFNRARVSDFHLKGTTGYGYGDCGREVLENIYADIFRAEKALVRGQIVSGTHAIALCLFGILRPGEHRNCCKASLKHTVTRSKSFHPSWLMEKL